MHGSVTIATIFGTKVRMHLTFLILLLWVAVGEGLAHGWEAAVIGIIFVLLLFVCVIAHEFGHVLVARHYGGRTRDILLLPIGGVSRMERIPDRPKEELAVAIAGPLVSVAIGGLLILVAGAPSTTMIESYDLGSIVPRLATANLFLAFFNLLPAFPMDGGRALRALLAMRMDRLRATKVAAFLGHLIAGLFVLLGLISVNPILLLIGVFIYFGASAESADTELRELAQTLTVSDVMRSNVRPISSRASLGDAIELMLQAGQHAIPVIGPDGSLIGVATKEGIIRAVHHSGGGALIGEAIENDIPAIASGKSLAEALELMRTHSSPAVLVRGTNNEFAGILTADTLADVMLLGSAGQRRKLSEAALPYPHSSLSVPRSV